MPPAGSAAAGSGLSRFRGALAESPPLWWAMLYFFCLLTGYYVLRPVRDAMGASSDALAVFPRAWVAWADARGWDLRDFTLMPSRFEPCGLSQMYAQKFGSLPIGHQTGGLAETITDGETGFLFRAGSVDSLVDRIDYVLTSLERLAHVRAQARRFVETERTWKASVARYCTVYDDVLRASAASVRPNATAIR